LKKLLQPQIQTMRYFPITISIWSLLLETSESKAEPNMWYCSHLSQLCYIKSDELTKFSQAEIYCGKQGNSKVTSIISDQENSDVADLCGCQSCWVGLVEESEGNWYWVDGTNSTYRRWDYGQPNNYHGPKEILAAMNMVKPDKFEISRKWWDVSYNYKCAAICKLNKTSLAANGISWRALTDLEVEDECAEPGSSAQNLDWLPFVIIPIVLVICCVGFYVWRKKRNNNSAVGQQMAAEGHSSASQRQSHQRREGEPLRYARPVTRPVRPPPTYRQGSGGSGNSCCSGGS